MRIVWDVRSVKIEMLPAPERASHASETQTAFSHADQKIFFWSIFLI